MTEYGSENSVEKPNSDTSSDGIKTIESTKPNKSNNTASSFPSPGASSIVLTPSLILAGDSEKESIPIDSSRQSHLAPGNLHEHNGKNPKKVKPNQRNEDCA